MKKQKEVKTPFDYKSHELAAAIFMSAERQVRFPHDDPHTREWVTKQAEKALETCKTENRSWFPVSERYTGRDQKKAGLLWVAVKMNDGYSYGFLFPPSMGYDIFNLLDKLYNSNKEVSK